MKYQVFGILWTVFNLALMLVMGIVGIYLLWLVIKALRVYINSHEVREEKKATRKSLAEALRENRVRCKMTQEFVSETIGVSRQAVSKWENGESLPDTNKLLAIGRLLGVTVDYLLDDEQTDPAPTSAGPRKSGFARFWRTYGFVSGYLISLVGILGLVRIAATLAAGFRLGGIADFGSVDPQWLEGLSTSPIFTDLSSRYRQALILSQIPDFLLCAALTAGGFLLARWLRRKYRTA